MFQYLIARLLSFAARRLPQGLLYAVAAVIGDVLYTVWWRGRRNALENMRRTVGPGAGRRQVSRAARSAFRNCIRYYVEFLRGHEALVERVDIAGMENVDAALAGGNGAILVGLHLGSPEMVGLSVTMNRYILNVLVDEKYANDRVNRWIQTMRARFGMKAIAAKKEAMPNLVRALKRNELIGLLIDCPHLANIKVRFCGAKAKVPGGAAALSLRTGAKIVPGAVVRKKGNRFTAYFDKPLEFRPTGDFSTDVQVLTQRIMDSLEPKLRDYPEQWFLFRRIWVES